ASPETTRDKALAVAYRIHAKRHSSRICWCPERLPMDPALAPGTPPRTIVFQDGLGERRRISDVSGADTIEQLCLRAELTAIPSFEFALRERASRLASFRHVYFGRVRSVDRL